MLQMSKHDLLLESKNREYRPEILEKVYRLLDLLEELMSIPYLKARLALKGGTAINLFFSQHVPRLSVDLDFNYIGSADRHIMLQEKEQIETIVFELCQRLRYTQHRNPRAHAGGKMVLVYQSIMGNKGRLEIDLNYIFRVPLWDVSWLSSPACLKPTKMAILDMHELAAGKLHALLGREASRDLFDSNQILSTWPFDPQKLRLAFTVYAAMERDNWQRISPDNIQFTIKDVRDKLIPVLKNSEIPSTSGREIKAWTDQLVEGCKAGLTKVLPFESNEIEFLERLHKFGEIKPELVSADSGFCERVVQHPSLLWRAKQALK